MAKKREQAQQQTSSDNTPVWAMGLVVACTLLIALAQVLLKMSLNNTNTLEELLLYPLLYVGLIIGTSVGFLLTFALKHGDLSVLHPFIAVGFIWVTLASIFVIGESPDASQLAGVGAIIVGVAMIGGTQ